MLWLEALSPVGFCLSFVLYDACFKSLLEYLTESKDARLEGPPGIIYVLG